MILKYIYLVSLNLMTIVLRYSNAISAQQIYRPTDNVQSLDLAPPKPGWVDPFAMLGDSSGHKNLIVQSDVDNYVLKNRLNKCETYMRRFINLFLRRITSVASMDKSAAGWVELVKLEFLISQKEFDILQEFGEHGECGDKNIEEVSELLSSILTQTINREKSYYGLDLFLHWIQKIFSKLVISTEWAVVISIFILFFTTSLLVYKHLYHAAFLMFCTTIFICGFGFTWMRMYEEKESEKYANLVMHGSAPYHCQGKQLQWYTLIYYKVFGANCQEFYKMRDVRSIVKVSPTDVLAETVSTMVVIPLKYAGVAYGNFITSFTDSFPFWMKPFAGVLGALITILIILLLLTFFFKYRLSISWTGVYFVPVLFHNREAVQAPTRTKYIEDLPCKDKSQLQSATSRVSERSEDNKPLFVVMNVLGLKKFVSSTDLSRGKNKGDEKLEDSKSDQKDPEEHSDKEESSEMEQMEELLDALQDNKNSDECKRRQKSIFTKTESRSFNKDTGSSLDHTENSVPDDDDLFPIAKDKQTEIKDKTM